MDCLQHKKNSTSKGVWYYSLLNLGLNLALKGSSIKFYMGDLGMGLSCDQGKGYVLVCLELKVGLD